MAHVQRFGAYLLLEQLSHASMTEVWTAIRAGDADGRLHVLKRPRVGERATGAAASAVRREAELLEALGGGRLPALVESGEVGGLPFVVIEHIEGVDLLALRAQRPSREEAMAIARDLSLALAQLHAAGWVHADVAPANVIVDDAGEARLIDFGIALRIEERRPHPAGKPGYVAPEVLAGGPADPAWDVFGLGVLVAELLTGERLYDDVALADAAARKERDVTGIDVPWVVRALARDASERPRADALFPEASIDPAVRERLARKVHAQRMQQHEPGEAAPSREVPVVSARLTEPIEATRSPAPAPGRHRRTYAIAGTLLAAALVAAGFGVGRLVDRDTPRDRGRSAKREAHITFPLFPARTEVELDGRTIIVPEAGKAMPIDPGKHTLTVGAPRRERKAYDFVVEEGDHVLVLTLPGTVRDRGGDAK